MANIFRLIQTVILLFVITNANAFAPTPPVATYQISSPAYSGATPQIACSAFSAYLWQINAGVFRAGTSTATSATNCRTTILNMDNNNVAHTYNNIITLISPSCPSNSTLVSGACVCNAGMIKDPNANACINNVNNCSSLAGKSAGTFSGLGMTGDKTYCFNASSSGDPNQPYCTVTGYANFAAMTPEGYKWSADLTYTGGKCSPGSGSPNTPAPDPSGSATPPPPNEAPPEPQFPPSPCKPGTFQGEVNGVTVCVPPAPNTPTQSTQTNTSTVSTDSGTTTTTEKKDTNCTGTQCTTTTTTTTSDGINPPATVTKTETCTVGTPGCTNRPTSGNGDGDGEGDGSSFGGSCGQGFTCDGDAIQCAIAQDQHLRHCRAFDDRTSDELKLYDSEKGKTGSVTDNLSTSFSVTISPDDFDSSSLIGSGSCIADKSINVMGNSITLPFSTMCPYLGYLGQMLLAVSFMLAIRIVTRG